MHENSEFYELCAASHVSGPVTSYAIAEAQRKLDVVFPEEYCSLLLRFGAVLGEGMEIWGLPDQDHDAPLWQDVVNVNARLREWGQIGTERRGFLAISEDGLGNYLFLNTNVAPETELWKIGPSGERRIPGNMAQFFMNLWPKTPASPQP